MKDIVKKLFTSNDWVILDTETTGLDTVAEACQIGVLAPDGTVLLDTLVRPTKPLTPELTAIHGISNEMLVGAPEFMDVLDKIHQAIAGKSVVVYNAPYDRRIIEQSYAASRDVGRVGGIIMMREIMKSEWLDVMAPYAEYYGQWSNYHQSYTWQSLVKACRQQGVPVSDAHSAIGDCRMTLALLKAIWQRAK